MVCDSLSITHTPPLTLDTHALQEDRSHDHQSPWMMKSWPFVVLAFRAHAHHRGVQLPPPPGVAYVSNQAGKAVSVGGVKWYRECIEVSAGRGIALRYDRYHR